MTSLSDSQNIDLDPNAGSHHPQLPPGSPLQACPHCQALIDITEREPLEVIGCPGCGQHFAVSGQIDHYQIIDVAGKGGMGVVYKAYDPGLDRYVALKLLKKSQSSDTELIAQLEMEAAITASVTDSNVVRVFGTGRDRGRFFIAMELVDKGSLDDLIHLQGRVAEAQVLEVGIQIASGLRAAQQHGLIHRDVKPGNILFADAHTAKIVDFGLAIFMAQEESVRGEIWGTPYYVAPEKLDQEPEDFRSDMYSLGATLFHALAGRPPFEAENASLVALKHLKSQAVSLQAFAPWVSNPTAHIINRTLAKNPDARFQSYDDLINNFGYALEQLQQHGNAPQKRARVVLETEEDRKSWTWVVLGMAAVMAIILVLFFTMRPKGNGNRVASASNGKPATSEPASSQKDHETLSEPIKALASRDKSAVEGFRKVVMAGNLSPTDRMWAQYLEGLAALAAGRTSEARTAFAKVEGLAALTKDAAVAKFLTDNAARLSRSEPITVNEVSNLSRKNHELVALLAFGLQNWHLGKIDDGVALLRQFRSAKPEGAYAWLESLDGLADGFVEEFTRFDMDLGFFKAATTPAKRAEYAGSLQNYSADLVKRAEPVLKPFAKEIEEQRALLDRVPEQGLYRITNKKSGKSLDVSGYNTGQGASLTQYDFRGQPNQIFELSASGPGTFRLRSIHSFTSIDVPNKQTHDGLEIKMWTDNDTVAQQWKVEPNGAGWHNLRAVCSEKLLGTQNQSVENAAKIVQSTGTDSSHQLWKFEPIGKKLTDGWYNVSIGERDGADKAEYKDGVFKLTDKGPDIWGKTDKANFIMRPIQGDFDAVVRVVSIAKTNQWTKAGLMVRAGLANDSMNVAAILTPDRMATHQRRPSNNGDTGSNKFPGFDLPRWIKIERRGEKITTFHSGDGQTWEQMGSESFKMNAHALVGLVASSHDTAKSATAQFDNLSVTKK